MNKKMISGLAGIVGGGAWFLNNYKYFDKQGFVAVGMPLLIFAAGFIFFIGGLSSKREK